MNQAYLYEAFGEHFLTDCFSAGHIRTPRTTIFEWYKQHWAARAKEGLESGTCCASTSRTSSIPPETMLKLAARSGRGAAQTAPGPAVQQADAGSQALISGTIHDYEGDQGVRVTAKALARSRGRPTAMTACRAHAGATPPRRAGQAEQLAVPAIASPRIMSNVAFAVGRQLAAEGDTGR